MTGSTTATDLRGRRLHHPDINDKAMSMTGGLATLHNVLVFNADRAFGVGRLNSTFSAAFRATPEIVGHHRPQSALLGDIDYTDGGDSAHVGCGTGNISVNPQFTDVAVRLQTGFGSPVLTAGPTGGRIGWLGFRRQRHAPRTASATTRTPARSTPAASVCATSA
jgi:hypothetical protein